MNDPRAVENPLTPQQIANLRRARGILSAAQIALDKAGRCGIDCRGEQAVCDAQCARIDAMLEQYGQSERKA